MTISKVLLISIHAIYQHFAKLLIFTGVIFSSGCSDWSANNTLSDIKIELWYQQQVLSCGQSFERDTLNWGIEQLAFFISDLHLVQSTKKQPLTLSINEWQSDNIALIRLAAADCERANLESTESQDNKVVLLPFQTLQLAQQVELTEESELNFTLGLPFAVNHLNPLSQASPLNMPSMFWSWRGGHKFFRVDMTGEGQAWTFHLGSTGCESPSVMRSPHAACVNPNTVQLSLAKQQDGQRLIIHLDKLLEGLELNSKSSCLMQPDKTSCQQLMLNLATNTVFEWR